MLSVVSLGMENFSWGSNKRVALIQPSVHFVRYLLLHVQAFHPDVSLKHLSFLRLRGGLPVNQDVVDAAFTIAKEKAAGFTPLLENRLVREL